MGVVTVLLAMWIDRTSTSYLVTLTLIFLSIYSTFRYGYWRVGTTTGFLLVHGSRTDWLQKTFVVALLLAEGYAALTLLLGYLQTLWPLRRMPVPLPEDPRDWPSVDLLIPTFNEPLSIVRYTALAALNIDWPADKLNVYLLDDGRREEFRQFAKEAGIGYITREGNEHAKAGNLNSALKQLSAPFVAVFDCDHVPTRSFLQLTMGWFLRDQKLGMLQTPQHLYSPDPFDRNLDQFRRVPNEGELFYGIVQDGNDFWNATLFCGSCAVLRRSALDEIGGIAPEMVTEDVHTSLRMQMSGWNTAYINIPQAAGLASESLDGHVKQRMRWARGMVQILRIDNPLFARGLTLVQRLCYFNSMFHFLYALPRLIFLVSPLAFLIFGRVILPGSWPAILAFVLPHLVMSGVANSRIQGQHRHSFWNEIYETILAPYILIPTLIALLRPSRGGFGVTAKGGTVERRYFDGKTALPFLLLMALQLTGLLFGTARMISIPWQPLLWLHHAGIPGAVLMNMLWASFNLVILGVCASAAWESHQRRSTVRLRMAVPVDVMFADGTLEEGLTADISNSGVLLRIDDVLQPRHGEAVRLIFPVLDGEASLPATVIDLSQGVMRAQFDSLTIQEQEMLTMVLYSRADTWLGWGDSREPDRPFKSMGRILGLAMRGVGQTFDAAWTVVQPPDNTKFAAGALQAGLLVVVFLGLTAAAAQFRSSQLRRAELKPVYQTRVDVGAYQPALRMLNPSLPAAVASDGLHPRDPQGFFASVRHAWWRLKDWGNGDMGKLDTSAGLPEAVMEGAEWPAGSGRSVVVVSVRDKESMTRFLAAYPDPAKSSEIAGSVSILGGGRFASYRIGDDVYYAGSRSPWMATGWILAEFPWLLILAVTAVSAMMAVIVRIMLRQKARERLLVAA